jgi:hypothetical protein
MNTIDNEKTKDAPDQIAVKKPYEKARITEHEPLHEAAASLYVYYYYKYIF